MMIASDRDHDRPTGPRPASLPWLLAVALAAAALSAAGAATLELSGPPGARVSVDGRDLGVFPLDGPLTVDPGVHEIRCSLPGHAPYARRIALPDDRAWIRVRVRLERYSRTTAVGSNLILAGLGQQYLHRDTRGWIFTGLELGGLLTALYGELSLQNHKDDYEIALDAYRSAVNAVDIGFYREQVLEFAGKMDDDASLRRTGLLVAVGAVAVSVLDAWLNFPGVTAGTGSVPVLDRAGDGADAAAGLPGGLAAPGLHAAWRIGF